MALIQMESLEEAVAALIVSKTKLLYYNMLVLENNDIRVHCFSMPFIFAYDSNT